MKVNVVVGKFRSRDTARLAVRELGEQGYYQVFFHQLTEEPVQGVDPMNNPYSGELPAFARGVMGSDIAVEGRSDENLYNKDDVLMIMGGKTGEPPAFAVAVNVTHSEKPHFAEDILKKHGAVTSTHEFDVEEEN